jgi:phosphate-selective porin OprO/OprP
MQGGHPTRTTTCGYSTVLALAICFATHAFADVEPDRGPEASSAAPSLEEQLAELRARVDELTRAPQQIISPISNKASSPSTVPASLFGPDAPPGTGTFFGYGLAFTSSDGSFKTHIGGLVQLDAIGYSPNTPGITSIPDGAGLQDSVSFRRLRFRAEGIMYDDIDWVSEFDFAMALQNTDQLNAAAQNVGLRSFPTGVGVQAGNTINVIQPTTVFLTFKDIPVVGNIRVGNQQNWISLEHIESVYFLDFMERAPIMDAFSGPNNNGYAPGISVFNNTPDKMAGLQLGVYKNNLYDSGNTFDIGDAWVYGGRGFWTPWFDEESNGRNLLHLGVGSEYRTFNKNVSATTAFDNVRVRSQGDLRNAASTLDPNFADTGNFYATSQVVLNPELAFQWGPLLVQAEYSASWFYGALPAKNVTTSLGSVFVEGGYVETLYFLTGENRFYNRQLGTFGRTIPRNNANFKEGTWGAWQVGLRYDWLDLNSGTLVNGGNASNITVGLNWFLNPNARFQFNCVVSWVNNAPPVTFPGTVGALNGSRFVGDGTITSFGGRMDFNF